MLQEGLLQMRARALGTATAEGDEVNYVRVLRQVWILDDATQSVKEQHHGPIPTRGYNQTEGDEVGGGGGTATRGWEGCSGYHQGGGWPRWRMTDMW
jgi:hypothetical protein